MHVSIFGTFYTGYKRLSFVGQRPTCPVEGVVVDVVEILPARPVDTGVREEGSGCQDSNDDGCSRGNKGGR